MLDIDCFNSLKSKIVSNFIILLILYLVRILLIALSTYFEHMNQNESGTNVFKNSFSTILVCAIRARILF